MFPSPAEHCGLTTASDRFLWCICMLTLSSHYHETESSGGSRTFERENLYHKNACEAREKF